MMTHPFEHIMPGPFSIASDTEAIRHINKNGIVMAFCDHCGSNLKFPVWLKGANGIFCVGSTCVAKLSDELPARLSNAVKTSVKQRRDKVKRENQAVEYDRAYAWVSLGIGSYLEECSHPKGWADKTLADHLSWWLRSAEEGMCGKARFIAECKAHGFS